MATTRITDVRTVGIPVTDQDRALEFYTGRLGFEKRMDAPMGEGMRWIEVAPPGASTSIALVAAGEGTPVGVDTPASGSPRPTPTPTTPPCAPVTSTPTTSSAGRECRRCSPSATRTPTPYTSSRKCGRDYPGRRDGPHPVRLARDDVGTLPMGRMDRGRRVDLAPDHPPSTIRRMPVTKRIGLGCALDARGSAAEYRLRWPDLALEVDEVACLDKAHLLWVDAGLEERDHVPESGG